MKRKPTKSNLPAALATYKRRRPRHSRVAFVDLVKRHVPDLFTTSDPPLEPLVDSLPIPDIVCEQADIELAIDKFYSSLVVEESYYPSTGLYRNNLPVSPNPSRDASPVPNFSTPRSLFGTPIGEMTSVYSAARVSPCRREDLTLATFIDPTLFGPRADTSSSSSPQAASCHAGRRPAACPPLSPSPAQQHSLKSPYPSAFSCLSEEIATFLSSTPSMEIDEFEHLFAGSSVQTSPESQISDTTLFGESTSSLRQTSMDVLKQLSDKDSLFGPETPPFRPPVQSHPRHQGTSIKSPLKLDLLTLSTRRRPPPNVYDGFDIRAGDLILVAQGNVRFQVWRSELAVYSSLFHYIHRNHWANLKKSMFDCVELDLDACSVGLVLRIIRK